MKGNIISNSCLSGGVFAASSFYPAVSPYTLLFFFFWCTLVAMREVFRAENLIGEKRNHQRKCVCVLGATVEYNILKQPWKMVHAYAAYVACVYIHLMYIVKPQSCTMRSTWYVCWPSCLSYHLNLLLFFSLHISIWHTKHGVQYTYSSSISCTK